MSNKNGFRTSEFWIAVVTILINVLVSSGVLSGPAPEDPSFVPAGIAAGGYAVARGLAKLRLP